MSDTNDPGNPTPPETPVPPVPPAPPAPPAQPEQPEPEQPQQPSFSSSDEAAAAPQPAEQQPTSVLPGFEGSAYNGSQQPVDQQPTTALPQPGGAPAPAAPQYAAAPPAAPLPPQQPQQPQQQFPQPAAGGPAPGAGYPGYAPAPRAPKGLAITALVLGIVAVAGAMIFGWIPFVGGVITIVVGIAALILGILAMQKRQPKGMALTGLILGGVGVLVGAGIVIAWSMLFASVGSELDRYSTELEDLQSEIESTIPGTSELDDSGASSDTASGERSPEFCTAFNVALETETDPSSSTWSEAKLAPYVALSSIDSPNREVYERFVAIAGDPNAITNPDYGQILSDFTTAMFDDAMACA